MSFARVRELPHTLPFRLTVWYAAIFAASSTLVFALLHLLLVGIVRERRDEELREDLAEYVELWAEGGLVRVEQEFTQEARDAEVTRVFLRLWSGDGSRLLAVGVDGPGIDPPIGVLDAALAGAGPPADSDPVLVTMPVSGHEHPFRAAFGVLAPGYLLGIGHSLEDDDELIAAIRSGFLAPLVALLLLGGPIGWFMARRSLAGVEELTRTAREIAGGAFDRRVAVRSRGDELDRLADTFNMMLDRIESLIRGMREMTDSLAHDLRSPLARIRSEAEAALAAGRSDGREELAVTVVEECDRLMTMIDATLDIAEAESGAARLRRREVDLVELAEEACEVFRTVAEDKRIHLVTPGEEKVCVSGDLSMLQRVVANLLDNAIKYTPEGGTVTIEVGKTAGRARLSVADTGAGIDAQELSRIFERFYRGDRSRSGPGNGLGLSMALAFARAHGGDLLVASTPGAGSTFTVDLPRSE